MSKKFKDFIKEMEEQVKVSKSTGYSKSGYAKVLNTLVNDTEYTENVLVKKGDDFEKIQKNPAKRYRESLKPVLKQFGIDSAEMSKLDTIQFNNEHAEAIAELSDIAMKNYLNTGKTYKFPMTSTKESSMGIKIVDVKEKENEKRVIVKKGNDYVSEKTNEVIVTSAHKALKCQNKVHSNLKKTKIKK